MIALPIAPVGLAPTGASALCINKANRDASLLLFIYVAAVA